MRVSDAVAGGLLLLLSLAVFALIRDFPPMPGQKVGPALYPGVIAAALFVASGLLIVQGWRKRHSEPWVALEAWARQPGQWLKGIAVVVLSTAYVLWSDVVGFIPTGVLLLTALFTMLRVRLAAAVIVAIVATLVIHGAFYKILKVPLPWGLLEPFAW
jgi:putative tricarboxylic transport membrane protein